MKSGTRRVRHPDVVNRGNSCGGGRLGSQSPIPEVEGKPFLPGQPRSMTRSPVAQGGTV